MTERDGPTSPAEIVAKDLKEMIAKECFINRISC